MSNHGSKPDDDDIYDLREEPAPITPPARDGGPAVRISGTADVPDETVAVSPVGAKRVAGRSVMAAIPYRKGLSNEPIEPSEPPSSQLRDVIVPIVLIVAGLIATVVDGTHADGRVIPLSAAIGPVTLNVICGLALAVAAVFGASLLGGISFHEPPWQIILKVCSVALLPGPLGSMADHAVGGMDGNIVGAGRHRLVFRLVLGRLSAQLVGSNCLRHADLDHPHGSQLHDLPVRRRDERKRDLKEASSQGGRATVFGIATDEKSDGHG